MHPALTTLIVDDELQSRLLIKKLLTDLFPGFYSDEAATVNEALNKINSVHPDLVFLDVQMRGETGFDLLDKLHINFDIIFTTAHSEFAVKAFRYSAIDYLVKPIAIDEFKEAVQKVVSKPGRLSESNKQIEFLQQNLNLQNNLPDKIIIATTEGYLFIAIDEIMYCQANGNYTEFHLTNRRKFLSSYTLSYYSEILQPHHFFRIHRSYLVNLQHIKMYKRGDGGVVVMNNDDEIEISRSNRENFLKLLKG